MHYFASMGHAKRNSDLPAKPTEHTKPEFCEFCFWHWARRYQVLSVRERIGPIDIFSEGVSPRFKSPTELVGTHCKAQTLFFVCGVEFVGAPQ